MTQITKYRDIPQFVRDGEYAVNIGLSYFMHALDEYRRDGVNLDPDFQRPHVWTEEQQIAYLEYFLRGGRSGRIIYFNHPRWSGIGSNAVDRDYQDFVLVDGKQRIRAIERFVTDEIKVFGTRFSEFEDRPGMTHTVVFNVNTLGSKAEVLQWYLGHNGGGIPHTKKELGRIAEMLTQERAKSDSSR